MIQPVLYVSGSLPSLSETFVYRELFGLRDRGLRVAAASVHPPGRLDDVRAAALAGEVIGIYGPGLCRLVVDACAEILSHPGRSISTAAMALSDVIASRSVSLPRRFKVVFQMLAALALARRVRPMQIGHMHAHMAHVPTTITMYAAKQLGITFSFTGHANDLFPERTLLTEKLKRARFTVCISRWHRGFYQAIHPLPDDRLPVVRCGVDCPPPTSFDAPRRAVPRLVSVGRLVPKKGFDVLLQAVSNLSRQGRQLDVAIIGDGPQRDELQSLAAKLGVADCLRFLGAQSHDEVLQSLAGADLFVLPSRVTPHGDRDGIPVALMEAMAVGVCVIGGDLPAIRELVRHEETGLLVQPDDPGGLALAIRRLLEDPLLRRDLAVRGQAWVREEFSTERNIERLVKLFQECRR